LERVDKVWPPSVGINVNSRPGNGKSVAIYNVCRFVSKAKGRGKCGVKRLVSNDIALREL
jgi:hypothetical protein